MVIQQVNDMRRVFVIIKASLLFFRCSIFIIIFLHLVSCKKDFTGLVHEEQCDPTNFIDTTRSYFYYYFDVRKYLTLAPDLFFVKFDSTIDLMTAEKLFSEYNIIKLGKFLYSNSYLVKPPRGKRAEEFFTFYGYETECGFGNKKIIECSTPIFWGKPGIDSSLIILTDEFMVEIDTSKSTFDELIEINKKYFVEFVDSLIYIDNVYLFKVTKASQLNALDMANLYQDSSYAKISEPDFKLFGGWMADKIK